MLTLSVRVLMINVFMIIETMDIGRNTVGWLVSQGENYLLRVQGKETIVYRVLKIKYFRNFYRNRNIVSLSYSPIWSVFAKSLLNSRVTPFRKFPSYVHQHIFAAVL